MNLEYYALGCAIGFIICVPVYITIKTIQRCINRRVDIFEDDYVRDLKKLHERFDTINQYLAENHENIVDIKERLTFLEAYNSFTMAVQSYEPAQSNPRSEAAKEMWKRRKQKKLEKKE